MNRRKALKTIGTIVLAGAIGAGATSLIILSPKEGILEKKLTNCDVEYANFGPDDRVYYTGAVDRINVLSLKEPVVEKYKDTKLFVMLRDLEEEDTDIFPLPNIISMCATKYGVAAISNKLPLEYHRAQKEKGVENYSWTKAFLAFLFVFTPDGKLVSSKNIEDRIIDIMVDIFYGDEKGFYNIPHHDYKTGKSSHIFIPIDGSKPVKREGEPPGWEQYLKKRHETGKILLPKEFKSIPAGGIDHYIFDVRDTEKGREVLYSKMHEAGLYYTIIPKDKLTTEKK